MIEILYDMANNKRHINVDGDKPVMLSELTMIIRKLYSEGRCTPSDVKYCAELASMSEEEVRREALSDIMTEIFKASILGDKNSQKLLDKFFESIENNKDMFGDKNE